MATNRYYVRTTGDRILDKSYKQIEYELLIDTERKPVDHFIQCLFKISNTDSILLEDDLILCDNFKEEISKAIKQYPNRIINFFQCPYFYKPIIEESYPKWNQCTFYPQGVAQQIAEAMSKEERNVGMRKNMYSIIEGNALTKLGIQMVQYRPHLVQHLDFNTFLFGDKKKTFIYRRSPFFIDYLKKLGISYNEAGLRQKELLDIMEEQFKEYENEYNNRLREHRTETT